MVISQFFRLEGDVVEPEIVMTPTGQCEVTVVDAAGQPLPDVSITFSPNCRFPGIGNTLVGMGGSSLEILKRKAELEKFPREVEKEYQLHYGGKTDARGQVMVSNLPVSRQSADVTLEGYEIAPDSKTAPQEWRPHTTHATIRAKEVTKLKVTLRRKPDPKPEQQEENTSKVQTMGEEKIAAREEPRLHTHPITLTGRARDEAGKPVANAKVYLLSTLSEDFRRVAETTTDAEGRYAFRDAPLPMARPEKNAPGRDEGSFEVLGVAEGYGFAWRPQRTCQKERSNDIVLDWVDPPAIVFADEPMELDLSFPSAALIKGRIVDEQGRPIEGVRLELRYSARIHEASIAKGVVGSGDIYALTAMNSPADVPPEVKIRLTAADGRFEFTGLPPECLFRIDLRHMDSATTKAWAATTKKQLLLGGKTLIWNAEAAEIRLAFAPLLEAKVHVNYADTGKPAVGVSVLASGDSLHDRKTTDENGEATLRMPVGEYAVHLLPARESPYFETSPDKPLKVAAHAANEPAIFELRPACVL